MYNFGRNNSGDPIGREDTILRKNEDNDPHPTLLSDSETEDEFGEDQERTMSTYLDSSNPDAELIQLLLNDREFEDQDDSATTLTPTSPGPSSFPVDISHLMGWGLCVPSCDD